MDDAGPGWSDIAVWYDHLLEGGSGPHETALACLLRLVGPLDGAEVLDIACGQGMATRALARGRALRVIGIDSSQAMLDLARRHDQPGMPITYVHDDAQTLATCGDASFDVVTCQLGLMDIADLEATLRSVGRVLRPGGRFVFVIGHPCYLAPGARPAATVDGQAAVQVTEYFEERFWRSSNPNGVRRVGNHHRMLTTYLNALVTVGFVIEAVEEPEASPRLVDQQPVYAKVPIFFAARTRRPPPPAGDVASAGGQGETGDPTSEITPGDYERARVALLPFVEEYHLGLNPEDMDEITHAVLRLARSTRTFEEIDRSVRRQIAEVLAATERMH